MSKILNLDNLSRLPKDNIRNLSKELGVKFLQSDTIKEIASKILASVKSEEDPRVKIISRTIDDYLDIKCKNVLFPTLYQVAPDTEGVFEEFIGTDREGVCWARDITSHYSGAGAEYIQFKINTKKGVICRREPVVVWKSTTSENHKQYYIKWKAFFNSKKELKSTYAYPIAVYNNGDKAVIAMGDSELLDELESRGFQFPGDVFITYLNAERYVDLTDGNDGNNQGENSLYIDRGGVSGPRMLHGDTQDPILDLDNLKTTIPMFITAKEYNISFGLITVDRRWVCVYVDHPRTKNVCFINFLVDTGARRTYISKETRDFFNFPEVSTREEAVCYKIRIHKSDLSIIAVPSTCTENKGIHAINVIGASTLKNFIYNEYPRKDIVTLIHTPKDFTPLPQANI